MLTALRQHNDDNHNDDDEEDDEGGDNTDDYVEHRSLVNLVVKGSVKGGATG